MHACILTPNEARREGSPASQEDVDSWFDKDGRPVKEAKDEADHVRSWCGSHLPPTNLLFPWIHTYLCPVFPGKGSEGCYTCLIQWV
ncbi:hypothetical protein EMCRGX_G001970 [Ephydatia muelleri]